MRFLRAGEKVLEWISRLGIKQADVLGCNPVVKLEVTFFVDVNVLYFYYTKLGYHVIPCESGHFFDP